MKSFPRLLAYVAAAGLLAGVTPAQEKPRAIDLPKKKPTVMQRKLTHAQTVLEGLAKEDFDKIRTGADGLLDCIKDATWRINDTEKYLMQSDNFRRTVESVAKAAKDKKIDAAALAYVDMTLACVKCHRYLREDGRALAPRIDPPAVTAGAARRR